MIRPARTEELDAVREIFREYAQIVGDAICFESYERELAELPGKYAPPTGGLFLVEIEGLVAACVAFRQLTADTAEMKRLYVRPAFRGNSLGRLLVEQIQSAARIAGYSRICLDTLPKLQTAIAMYRNMGFNQIDAYPGSTATALCFERLL